MKTSPSEIYEEHLIKGSGWGIGFYISQEIYKETSQRPLIVNKETQAGTKA